LAARASVRTLDDSSASPDALAEAVQTLDRLGFRAQALRAEDEIAGRFASRPLDLAVFRDSVAQKADAQGLTSTLIDR
jgi:hypothetical protein